MTTTNALQIAAIISTLTASILQPYIQVKLSRPKAIPETNQPKKLSQRIVHLFAPLASSPWFFLALAVVNIIQILPELRSKSPVTRVATAQICLGIGSVFWCLMGASMTFIWRALDSFVNLLRGTILEQNDINKGLLDVVSGLNESTSQIGDILMKETKEQAKMIDDLEKRMSRGWFKAFLRKFTE
jgi:hypothetical protein